MRLSLIVIIIILLSGCGKGDIRGGGYKLRYDQVNSIKTSPQGDRVWVSYIKDGEHFILLNGEISGPYKDVSDQAFWNETGTGLIYAYQKEKGWYVSSGIQAYGPFTSYQEMGYVQGLNGYYFFADKDEDTYFYYNNISYGPYDLSELIESPVAFSYPDGFSFAFTYRWGESHFAVFGNRSNKYLGRIDIVPAGEWNDSMERFHLDAGLVYDDKDSKYLWVNGEEIGPLELEVNSRYAEQYAPISDFYYYEPGEYLIYHYRLNGSDYISFDGTDYGPYISAEMIEFEESHMVVGYGNDYAEVMIDDDYIGKYDSVQYKSDWEQAVFAYTLSNKTYLWSDQRSYGYDGKIQLAAKIPGKKDMAYSYINDNEYYIIIDANTNGPYQVMYNITTNFPVGTYTNLYQTNALRIEFDTNLVMITNYLLIRDEVFRATRTNILAIHKFTNRYNITETVILANEQGIIEIPQNGEYTLTNIYIPEKQSPADEQINLFQSIKDYVSSFVTNPEVNPNIDSSPSAHPTLQTNNPYRPSGPDPGLRDNRFTFFFTNLIGTMRYLQNITNRPNYLETHYETNIYDEDLSNLIITNLVTGANIITNQIAYDLIDTNMFMSNLVTMNEIIYQVNATDIVVYDEDDMIIRTNLAMELGLDNRFEMFSYWSNHQKYVQINSDLYGPYDQSVFIQYQSESREFAFAYLLSNRIYLNVDDDLYGPYLQTDWLSTNGEIPYSYRNQIFSTDGRDFLFTFTDDQGVGINVNGDEVNGFLKVIAKNASGVPFLSDRDGSASYFFLNSSGEYYAQIGDRLSGPYDSISETVDGIIFNDSNYLFSFKRDGIWYADYNGKVIPQRDISYQMILSEPDGDETVMSVGLSFLSNDQYYVFDGDNMMGPVPDSEPSNWSYNEDNGFILLYRDEREYQLWSDGVFTDVYDYAEMNITDDAVWVSGVASGRIYVKEYIR